MSQIDELNLLIEKARAIAGNDSQLAKRLGVPPQRISDWRAERRTATPEDHALLASIAGLDPVAELARAMVKKHEGTAKGDRLMRALGKALLVTGAGIGSAGANAAAIFSSMPTPSHALEWVLAGLGTMYRNVKSARPFAA